MTDGYILIGPATISPETYNEAATKAQKVRDYAISICEHNDVAGYITAEMEEFVSDACVVDFEEFNSFVHYGLSTEQILNAFKDIWESPESYNLPCRFRGNEQIVFVPETDLWNLRRSSTDSYFITCLATLFKITESLGIE